MSDYVRVPLARLDCAVQDALLEEFASRDGTDYGERELTLEEKAGNLRRQLEAGDLCLLYHGPSEQWDVVDRDRATGLLAD